MRHQRQSPKGEHRDQRGFTLVEIAIVVAIIGLIAVLVIPSMVKARKQSQGRRVVNDARIIDAAIDQWAQDNGKQDGDAIDTWSQTGIISYIKHSGPTGPLIGLTFNDVLGHPYGFATVGWNPQVRINFTTRTALDGVGIDWGQF